MGGKFTFTKLFVTDLDRSAAFYAKLVGYNKDTRIEGTLLDEPFVEVVLTSADGMSGLILITRTEGENKVGDTVLGFSTNDARGFLDEICAAGGSIAEAATTREYKGGKITVGFGRDPDGYLLEAVQAG